MADYVGLEDASGHVLLEDGTSGLLLETSVIVWTGAATVSETVTVGSVGKLTAHGSATVSLTVTIPVFSGGVLHGSATLTERVTVTSTGRVPLYDLVPAVPGSFALTPVDGLVYDELAPAVPGSFALNPLYD